MENNNPSQPNQQPLASGQQTDQFHSVSSIASSSPSKTFIVLIIIIMIVAVGAGGYILATSQSQVVQTQTQPVRPIAHPSPTSSDETANWKIYMDPKGIFSANYPASWYENKATKAVAMRGTRKPSPLGIIGPSQADVIDSGTLSRKIVLFQLENKSEEMSLDKYSYDPDVCKGDTTGYCDSHTPYPIERKKITVDGKEAIWQITSAAPSGRV